MATANLRREGSSLKSREDRAVRIEDYLNDKLQTHADLESINSLLENVQNQQKLLRQQVSIFAYITHVGTQLIVTSCSRRNLLSK
jgi:hypothetical protein